MTGATDRLAAHALDLSWDDIDAPARVAAATFLHDTIAVGAAGARAPLADAVRRAAKGWGGGGQSRLLGSGERLPAPSAAFVNAFQIHAQEFDAVHEGAVVHPMATVAAVLLAEVDRGGLYAGRHLLASLIVGVDVAVALGLAATTPLRFFRPATAGVFGSVAALARLRGSSPEVTRHAFGHALAFASGTMQAHVEASPALALQVAAAARSAIQAVDLAQAGVPGVSQAIDGPFGYLPMMEAGFDLTRVLAELPARRRIGEVSWKPFPNGRAAHGAIVATQRLMARHGVNTGNLAHLVVEAPPLIERLVGRPIVAGMAPSHARLCFPYLGAVTITRGTVTLSDFTPDTLHDPAIAALAARITVRSDGNPDPAAFVPQRVTVRMTDGREATETIEALLGAPAAPLSPEQHEAKARTCLATVGLADRADALSAAAKTLAEADDARLLLDILQPSLPAGSTK